MLYFKKYPRITALLFGSGLCLVLILAFEGIFRLVKFNDTPIVLNYPDLYYEKYEFGVKRARIGKNRVFAKNKKTGKLIYDVVYTVDDRGRRSTPVTDREQRNTFILFFGGSFTYGEGVNDDQTLPHEVGRHAPHYMPYNYGFHGLGPFDALAKIENIDFSKEVTEKNGIAIYTYMDGHIHRVVGSMIVMGWKHDEVYYRKADSGELVRMGTFETGRPFLTFIYSFLNKLEIFKALHINFPLTFSDHHIELTALCFQNMRDEFRKKYPYGDFYVVIYPGSRYSKLLTTYFNDKGIRFLDYSRLFNARDPKFCLAKEDFHPSALAYQTIAEKIVKDLHLHNVK
jgi:hypothetical protein